MIHQLYPKQTKKKRKENIAHGNHVTFSYNTSEQTVSPTSNICQFAGISENKN
jgi:hypothetical protein